MALKRARPAPGERHGASGDVDAGAFDSPENGTNLPQRQAEHLSRRFHLPEPIARAVAEIHFGRAA